ncbi:hypothetical protein [Methanoculleus chikugoensis]|uniref:hypothetical protein n=1 Tax=Methanoculleus chikugoensis TaxID=118126 RepID=UPI001FB393B2|nr:hypothetical protein [Methanoculleus chikugoensis]
MTVRSMDGEDPAGNFLPPLSEIMQQAISAGGRRSPSASRAAGSPAWNRAASFVGGRSPRTTPRSMPKRSSRRVTGGKRPARPVFASPPRATPERRDGRRNS